MDWCGRVRICCFTLHTAISQKDRQTQDEQFTAPFSKCIFVPPNTETQSWLKILIWKSRVMVEANQTERELSGWGVGLSSIPWNESPAFPRSNPYSRYANGSTLTVSHISAVIRSWTEVTIPELSNLIWTQGSGRETVSMHMSWNEIKPRKTATITTTAWAGIPPNDYEAIWCSMSTNGGINFAGKAFESARSQKLLIEWGCLLRCGSGEYLALFSANILENECTISCWNKFRQPAGSKGRAF